MAFSDSERSEILNLTISELLRLWPGSAGLLISRRMACVGCLFSDHHSLAESLEIYGLPPDSLFAPLLQITGRSRGNGRAGASSREGDLP